MKDFTLLKDHIWIRFDMTNKIFQPFDNINCIELEWIYMVNAFDIDILRS